MRDNRVEDSNRKKPMKKRQEWKKKRYIGISTEGHNDFVVLYSLKRKSRSQPDFLFRNHGCRQAAMYGPEFFINRTEGHKQFAARALSARSTGDNRALSPSHPAGRRRT
ncbi:hypothetical protein RRG08_050534 [Elysia crispata]|uniref:Uncharacterized protein n=1 Tax=Elysia crispata TaxID=231223 RepID=A0AAE0ZUA2_9GAST|nr:hypothetical protein RRG08_050534 [Elysia crispata]